jgi:hypothetical protein
LRSRQLCSYSRTSQHFMQPEGSLPCSLVPILSQIEPVHTTRSYLSKIHFIIVHPPTSWSSQWSLPFRLSHQYPMCIFLLPYSCYIPCSSNPNSNYTWRRVQDMKLLIMQFSPTSCHFISLLSKYSPQHPVLKHPQSLFRP